MLSKDIKKIFADIKSFLMTSSNIDSPSEHSCEIEYFVNF